MVVIDLLNAIKRQADFEELAGIAWRDPTLAYRLLRFVNSAAMGLREKIDRLKTAMVYVGRDELYRWLTLLLFSSKKPDHLDNALRENALVRAKLAEQLAAGRMLPKERDEAFVVGILSVIDALLEMPMQEALAQLSLPAAVTEALLHREGKYAPYLKLAIACEESDQATIKALADELGMDAFMVNQRHIEALTWAMSFSEALEESHMGE
jgi:EAL and modified HD-GYP domain-containing signal transduction protein